MEPPTPEPMVLQTPELEIHLQPEGIYHGVTRLLHKKSGVQWIDERYSALNLFRLFSVNQAMGQPRTMERSVHLAENGMRVTWPPTDQHMATLEADWCLSGDNEVELNLTLSAANCYRAYELFLSSYFKPEFVPHVFLQPAGYRPDAPPLVVPRYSAAYEGTVIVFPRDTFAARHCVDGRWERREHGAPTVQMCPLRYYLHPMAIIKHPELPLGVVLMAKKHECYAISTRYYSENEAERLTTYSAFDLSLFGQDVVPEHGYHATLRLAVTELDEQMSQAFALYEKFAEQT